MTPDEIKQCEDLIDEPITDGGDGLQPLKPTFPVPVKDQPE